MTILNNFFFFFIQLLKNTHNVMQLQMDVGASKSHHGNEVEQVHAWLVGFGVGQLQQRSDTESSSVTGIAALNGQ